MALGAITNPLALWADESVGKGAIVVGPPKQYSHRYLQDQLDTLNGKLRTLTTLNAEAVKAAQGNFQGSSSQQSSFNVSITEIGRPKIETVIDDAKTTKTKTASEVTPTPPSNPEITPPTSPITNFGIGAQDLLEEQVRLRHQISNLRLLLDQAVSDKYIVTLQQGKTVVQSRLRVLLGFRVSLIPTAKHRDYAAVLQVKVEAPESKQPPSVVALMPEEKNYNATALTQKRGGFGAAALVGVFPVGISGSRGSDVFYQYQDTDTFAFELNDPDASVTSFGWQFRPVLNQRTVQPGPRYLFVALALDESSGVDVTDLDIAVTTHWQRYHRKKRHAYRAKHYAEEMDFGTLSILTEKNLQEQLAPKITDAVASSVEDGMVHVRLEGEELHAGSQILVGGKSVASGSIIHRSDRLVEFFLPTEELLGRDVHIVSPRYGLSTLVRQSHLEPPRPGFDFYYSYQPEGVIGDNLIVKLALHHPDNPNEVPDLEDRDVFITIGDATQVVRHWKQETDSQARKVLVRNILVDAKRWLTTSQTLNLEVPFLGAEYQKFNENGPLISFNRIELLTDDGTNVEWGVFGHGFKEQQVPKLYAGRELQVTWKTETELRVSGKKVDLSKHKSVLAMIPDFNVSIKLDAPGANRTPPKPKPSVLALNAVQNSGAPLEFVGDNLMSITKVEFEGKAVVFSATEKKLVVILPRDATKQIGTITLVGRYGESDFIPMLVKVQAGG